MSSYAGHSLPISALAVPLRRRRFDVVIDPRCIQEGRATLFASVGRSSGLVPWAHLVGQLGGGTFGVSGHTWYVVACGASSLAVLCTVRFVGPNYKNQGDSPRTSGGRVCVWPQFRFLPGWPNWLGGKRPPVPGRCTGLRTAPARIRGGTPRHSRTQRLRSYCSLWV